MNVDWEKIAGYVILAGAVLGAVKVVVNELGWKAKKILELEDKIKELRKDLDKEEAERRDDVRDLDRFIRLK